MRVPSAKQLQSLATMCPSFRYNRHFLAVELQEERSLSQPSIAKKFHLRQQCARESRKQSLQRNHIAAAVLLSTFSSLSASLSALERSGPTPEVPVLRCLAELRKIGLLLSSSSLEASLQYRGYNGIQIVFFQRSLQKARKKRLNRNTSAIFSF